MWEENDEIGNFEADSPCWAISAISPAPQDDQSARPATSDIKQQKDWRAQA